MSSPYQRRFGIARNPQSRQKDPLVDADEPKGADPAEALPPGHRSGFVAICGRPNVGKSTLLNALMGEPLAVATEHPQTTRERLLGIWTKPQFQAVLIDTPGIHRARSALNRYMVEQAVAGARDVDVVLLLAEIPALRDAEQAQQWEPGEVALQALEVLAELGHPIVLVLTKLDRLADRDLLIPILAKWSSRHDFAALIPTSATGGEGLEQLEQEVLARLPEGPRYYSAEDLTDRSLRWHVAELVRAELFEHLSQELPYSCAVVVTAFKERKSKDAIEATIFVERDSQKGMVIGKKGQTIKAIGIGSRRRIENLTGRSCDLRLQVAVAKNWTRDPEQLERFGYHDPHGRGPKGGA
jgi:GTP-binding protein Era